MHPADIQQDYGGFDLKFMGATIMFRSARTWELFMSTTPLHKSRMLQQAPDRAFEALSMATVLDHEVRHFHDFLLSPYSNHVFRFRLQALIHGIQIFNALQLQKANKDCNCLPVPISRWCGKGSSERAVLLSSWKQFLTGAQNLKPCELPSLPEDLNSWNIESGVYSEDEASFTNLFILTIRSYERIKQIIHNPKSPFQPCHVYELSALLVQMQSVRNAYGEEALQVFLDLLSQLNLPYIRLFNTLSEIWLTKGSSIDIRAMSAVIMWSLMGNYKIDEWKACTTYRLTQIWGFLSENGPPPSNKPFLEIFDEWSQKLGLNKVLEGLQHMRAANERFIEKLREGIHRLEAKISEIQNTFITISPHQKKTILSAAQMFCDATEYMINKFCENPETYIFPDLYIENIKQYVNPPILFEYNGSGALVAEKGYFDSMGLNLLFYHELKSGKVAVRLASPPISLSNTNLIDTNTAYNVFLDMTLIDYLFSTFNRSNLERERIREHLKRIGFYTFYTY